MPNDDHGQSHAFNKQRRALLLGGGMVAVTGAALAMGIGRQTLATISASAVVGERAPDFTTLDSDDRPVILSTLIGKPIVLEWTNPECPYVRKHYDTGAMQLHQAVARAQGTTWLTILSVAPGKQGYASGLEAQAWLDQQKARPNHFLLDPKGMVAGLYGVAVALHMVVIAADGKIAYMGAIDDRPTARQEDVIGARNYVADALKALAKGEPVKPAQTRPYGCRAT